MAITIIATVGGATSNAYRTEAEMADYMATRLGADAWTAADAETRKAAMVEAARELDLLSYVGVKASTSQARQFPRYGLEDENGDAIAYTIIPTRFLDGYSELVLYRLQTPTGLQRSGLAGFESLTVGPITLTPRPKDLTATWPDTVMRRIGLFLAAGLGRSQAEIVEG